MKNVCVITTAHPAGDNRIFHREIGSLTKKYKVNYITTSGDLPHNDNLAVIYIGGWENRLQRLRGNFRAFGEARRVGADIYHFHDPEFVPFAILLKWLKKKPVIYDIHEDYPAVVLGREWIPSFARKAVSIATNLGERLTLPFLDQLITASGLINERYALVNSNCTTIDNYPSAEIINKHYQKNKNNDIICLGDLNRIRGAEIVIPAVVKFLEGSESNFWLIGDIKPESLKTRLLSDVPPKIIKKMNILGRQDYDRAIAVASRGSVGILSYLNLPNHLNTSPNKIFEYMGLGLAVLASDLPNYVEAITKNNSGMSYKSASPEGLANALKKAFSDKAKLQDMQEKGRKAFLDHYNWTIEEAKLLLIYKELIGE